jgi:glycosyltransferase involved in cell wall biosynthesis
MSMLPGFEWCYLGLCYKGDPGMRPAEDGVPPYMLYPTFNEDIHVADNLPEVAANCDPDAIWIYEDAQNVAMYRDLKGRAPVIGYFAWDVDYWGSSMDEVIENVDVPVCMSDFAEAMIHERGYDVDKAYNCVDERVFKPATDEGMAEMRRMLGVPDGKKIVLYVGMLHGRKNPESLFAMAQELKRIRGDDFVLVVHGDPKFRYNSCDVFVEAMTRGIEKNVIFTPVPQGAWIQGIHPGRLNSMYNLADVYVSAHGGEGFGLPAAEAGLCGKPFVMTDCTTTREFSDGGRNGVAVPVLVHRKVEGVTRPMPDHVKMAEEVSALLDDEKRRKAMGSRWRDQVLSKYTMKALKPRWEAIFEKCFVNGVRVKEI